MFTGGRLQAFKLETSTYLKVRKMAGAIALLFLNKGSSSQSVARETPPVNIFSFLRKYRKK